MKKLIKDVLLGTIYMVFFLGCLQAIILTQDSQDSLNEIATRLNALEIKAEKVKIRHSPLYGVQQWLGGKLLK